MKMRKGQVSNILRQIGLLYSADWMRYYWQRIKNRRINREFRKNNPNVVLPPDYLIYESFQLNYQKYYTESIETAQWLADYFKKHTELENKKILDWGCGPARIIRHLPGIIGNDCKFYGTDYNQKTIEWCSKHLTGVNFNYNIMEAKLPFPDRFFDVIYGISIFTHLSEQMHYDWYKELLRILKPEGILFLTTQGDNFTIKMTKKELDKYHQDKLVIRGNVKEGHRTYSAFQPVGFMKKLFHNAEILEHVESKPEVGKGLPQDVWIIRKKTVHSRHKD